MALLEGRSHPHALAAAEALRRRPGLEEASWVVHLWAGGAGRAEGGYRRYAGAGLHRDARADPHAVSVQQRGCTLPAWKAERGWRGNVVGSGVQEGGREWGAEEGRPEGRQVHAEGTASPVEVR